MRLTRYDEDRPSKKQRRDFDCGAPSLDRWLATQARQSMESRDAVTYLLVDEHGESAVIAGYFCLSAGQIARDEVPGSMARRAPDAVPAIRMGRFAVDLRYHGRGWGGELLREVLLSAATAGKLIGARVLLVDALDDGAERFYRRFGFEASPTHPLQLVIDLHIVAASAGIDEER